MSNRLQTQTLLRPFAIILALGIGFAALGAMFVKPADQAATNVTDIVWTAPEGPPLTLTPVLGSLSSQLTATGLFGYPVGGAPAESTQSDLTGPTSDDRLPSLLVLGQKDDQMVAIARVEDGSLQTYSIGDTLESGWTISAMTVNAIEIERGAERDEILLRAALLTDDG